MATIRSRGAGYRRRLGLVLGLGLFALASPCRAGLTRADLDAVGLAPPPGARIPGALALETMAGRTRTVAQALDGRPTLLVPIDQKCRVICGPTLAVLAGALAGTGLQPGRDFRIMLATIGERDDAATRAFVGAQIDGDLAASTTTFTGPPEGIEELTHAIGYTSAPDAANGAIAHPAGFVALTGDGRVARVLSSFTVTPDILRLALIEAGEGRVGSLGDQLRLLCYGFDAAQGIYTIQVWRILQGGLILTLLILAGAVWLLLRRARSVSMRGAGS